MFSERPGSSFWSAINTLKTALLVESKIAPRGFEFAFGEQAPILLYPPQADPVAEYK
jgi:hypothetical protein